MLLVGSTSPADGPCSFGVALSRAPLGVGRRRLCRAGAAASVASAAVSVLFTTVTGGGWSGAASERANAGQRAARCPDTALNVAPVPSNCVAVKCTLAVPRCELASVDLVSTGLQIKDGFVCGMVFQ